MSDTASSKKPYEISKSDSSTITRSTRLSSVILPAGMQGFLAMSESLQRQWDRNYRIFSDALRLSAAQGSILEKANLRVALEASQILDAEIRSFELGKIIQSIALDQANTVNLAIGRLLNETGLSRAIGLYEQAAQFSIAWEKQLQDIGKEIGIYPRYDLALQSHLAEMAKLTILSQAAVSRMAWENIGNAININVSKRAVLQSSFFGFSQSYSKLFESWEKQPSYIMSLPPVISTFPAIEFFNGVDVVDSITTRPLKDIESQEEQRWVVEREDIRLETEDRLEELLGNLDSELIVPLRGARSSLESANPDYKRHFASSLRELFTHVLHALSPDEKIRAWSTASEHYDKEGKPTRRARLRYICRTLNHEPFSTFIEKDIDTSLVFLQLFQRGTHEVVSSYDDDQLRIMLVKMESVLRLLLEIGSVG